MKPLINAMLVGAGGFAGAVLRFAAGGAVHRVLPATFPYGTLAVNVLGCFVIGALTGVADARQVIGPGLRLFLLIGLLGGFTTFSTFGYETHTLLRSAEHFKALANVLLNVTLALSAVWIGQAVAKAW